MSAVPVPAPQRGAAAFDRSLQTVADRSRDLPLPPSPRIVVPATCWVLEHALHRHTSHPSFYVGVRGWGTDARAAIQFVRAGDATNVALTLPHGWHLVATAVEHDLHALVRGQSAGLPSTIRQPI